MTLFSGTPELNKFLLALLLLRIMQYYCINVLIAELITLFSVLQAIFSIIIFVLLSSQDGFSTKWHVDEHTGIKHAPALYNGIFSTIAFLVGAISSIVSGFIGMKIATYANSRTALEARKGIAAAFAVGMSRHPIFKLESNVMKYCAAP